jgi:multidrug efflux pump subunit AcrB
MAGLRRRWLTVAAVIVIFVGVMQLAGLVPQIFFPPNDRPTLTVELFLPTGTPLARTEALVEEVETFMKENLLLTREEIDGGEEGIVNWAGYIGEGAPRFFLSYGPEQASPEYAILLVNATSRDFVDVAVARLREFCSRFPGLKAKIDPLPLGPPADNPVEVRISGREPDEVFQLVDRVKDKLLQTPGTRGVADDWGARSKKLLVRINEARAQRAGVSNQDVAISLQTVFSGFDTTEYREGDKLIPVTLRSEQANQVGAMARESIAQLGSVNVFSQATGVSVPAAQVVDAELVWQPAKILRRNRLKTVTVESDLEPGYTANQINRSLTPWLEEESKSWPLGYSWELGGEEEEATKANASIAEQLPVAGLVIVLLLVAQFNSIRRPLIILITIPLGLIGVVIGLVVMRSYFGFMTLLGVISLAGIVINNAIVLLDRIKIEIEQHGLTPQHAVIEASQRRLRPILLTTVTTLGGLLPLYLGGGPMYQPMAVAIMFGLVFSTALTLGVVPVLYSLFLRVSYKDFTV